MLGRVRTRPCRTARRPAGDDALDVHRPVGRDFPEIEVDPNVLYVDAGQILTSAGTAAGIDLCLHVVRLDHGVEIANAVARRMVVPPHRDGGQAQFVVAPMEADDGTDPLAATLDWALEHLDEPLTVEVMSRRALMSPRTFAAGSGRSRAPPHCSGSCASGSFTRSSCSRAPTFRSS